MNSKTVTAGLLPVRNQSPIPFLQLRATHNSTPDIAGTDVDIDRIMIGLGGRIPLSNRIDLTANASAVYTDAGIEANAEEFDEWGYAVGLGLRIQVLSKTLSFSRTLIGSTASTKVNSKQPLVQFSSSPITSDFALADVS